MWTLRKLWEGQRPNVVFYVLGLIVTSVAGRVATVTSGADAWLIFFLILLVAWAVGATVMARRGRRPNQQPDLVTTTENIEQRLTEWIRKLKLRSKPLPDKPEAYHFNYQVDGPMGNLST